MITPAFVLEQDKLQSNLEKVAYIQNESGVEFILAFKAFAQWRFFNLINQTIPTATASSLWEAKLCYEEYKSKAHTYSPAYLPNEIDDILQYSSHITFNSLNQFNTYKTLAKTKGVSVGIRINPEYSDVETDIYNPCAPGSRLGIALEELSNGIPEGVDGFHFHTLCESSAAATCGLIDQCEAVMGAHFQKISWLNFGGGHLVNKEGYDAPLLISRIKQLRTDYPHLKVYIEPGSAILWNSGFLRSNVLDIVDNKGIKTAILNVSFTCHMPDTLEMPYRPNLVIGSSDADAFENKYRLGGVSCLSGDYLDEYSFPSPLNIGDTIIFKDMLHYTLVKTTMFNGVGHPDVLLKTNNGSEEPIRSFDYNDYKSRMC